MIFEPGKLFLIKKDGEPDLQVWGTVRKVVGSEVTLYSEQLGEQLFFTRPVYGRYVVVSQDKENIYYIPA